jgi:bile acid:Na+ symporter, BASS family
MNFIDILISGVLALIMYGVGVSITTTQVVQIYKTPKPFIVAITSQMVALPIIAFIIASIFDIRPEIKVGLVILAASPGGATSGFITYMFKGNTALSVVLTSVNCLLTLFSIPLIVNLALIYFMGTEKSFYLPFWSTVTEIFLVTIIPATLGILTRFWKESFAIRLSKIIKPILICLLGIVFLIKIVGNKSQGETGLTANEISEILPYCLLLNVCCLLFGFFLTGLFRLSHANRLTTAIESGVHNTTLAFLIASTLLKSPELAKPALVYAMISFWTALIFSYSVNIFYGFNNFKDDIKNIGNWFGNFNIIFRNILK